MLALAPLGFPALWRRDRHAALVCLGGAVGLLLFIASFHAWHGGFSTGPRYLIPSLPFWFLPTAFAMVRFPRVGTVLAVVSVVIMLSATVVNIDQPPGVRQPQIERVWPILSRGFVSTNTYGLDDLRPPNVRHNMNSFNLGELVFPYRLTSVLPPLAFWLLIGIALRRLGHAEA